MSYTPQWANGSGGRVAGGLHTVSLSDAEEIAAAINRRRKLTYRLEEDFSSHLFSGASVYHQTFDQLAYPFQDFRGAFMGTLLSPGSGMLGGEPASPTAMEWLAASGDVLVLDDEPEEGYASFFDELNEGEGWTDASLSGLHIRDVHINELRAATELLIRGRWQMPIYLSNGMFSMLPDTPWLGGLLANNGTHEVRTLGFAYISHPGDSALGLRNVTVLSASKLVITASRACSVAAYRCQRAIDWVANPATWNASRPGVESWTTPGGLGGGDASSIGTTAVSDDGEGNYVGEISGSGLAAALQAMVDGSEENFLLRRTDTSDPITANVSAELTVEFEVDTPPN